MMKKTSKMAPAKKMMSGGSTKKKMKYQNGGTAPAKTSMQKPGTTPRTGKPGLKKWNPKDM